MIYPFNTMIRKSFWYLEKLLETRFKGLNEILFHEGMLWYPPPQPIF